MNKMKKILSIALCFAMMFSCVQTVGAAEEKEAKQYDIYPIVREISYDGTEFTLDSQVNVVYENDIDAATKNYLSEVLTDNGFTVNVVSAPVSGESNILLGVNGSNGTADTYENTLTVKTADLYSQYDAYILEAKEDQITIVGKDTDAVYRGVATLKMMLSSFEDDVLLGAQIEDYAGIEFRGFIEGFYGGWDYETRAELMEFARDVKMNMYVYASKTDTYHTSNWAGLYPQSELAEIEELVKIGEETKCYYVWSVHLGSFFSGLDIATNPSLYETRYNQLVAKFTQLYNVGVRKFDILNDDFGSGSHADVVTLLNDLTEKFIEPMGCEPITYCPQGYNEAWSKWSSTINELPTLEGLDDSIMIYWTGADVNSPITQSTVDYVTEKTGGQPVAYWLNYPVNEHAKSGVFLGNIDHYARDGVTGLKAAVSNPSRFGQSNKVALFQLASLFWNNSNYSEHSEDVWLDSFNYLEEGVEEVYRTIGRNLANCPNSSRVSQGFPESEYIKENLEAVLAAVENGESVAALEDTEILLAEFANILNAIETFRKDCKNTDLVEELNPWLNSLTDAVVAAEGFLNSVLALEKEDYAGAWSNFAKASKAFQTWDSYLSAPDITNPALGGSKRIQPFAADLVSYVESTLTPIFDTNYSGQNLYAVFGGQKQSMDDNAAKMFDGDENTYAQWNIVQQKDDYFGVDLGVVKKVTDISIIQANSDSHHDYFHKAVLEYSVDGKTFTQLGERYNDTYRISLDNLDIQARYVRLRLVETGTANKPDYWTHVREFTVNKQTPDGDRVYTNVEAYAKQPLTIEGKEYSIRDLQNVTLGENDYLGLKFKDLVLASDITLEGTNTEGLEVWYSENGTEWSTTDFADGNVLVKYVVIEGSASFDLDKLGVTVESVKADPKFLETNLTNGIQQGSWENVFDGNDATFVWTNEGQTAGDYITFDLGAEIELYDFEIVTPDGNPRFYNAQIQISTDNANWTTVAEVVNDNSVFEVPYRYIRGNANGADARYLRIYITGNTGYYLKIHEIFFNTTVEEADDTSVIKATFGNDIEKAIDGNLSTIFAAAAEAGDSITYKFTESTNLNAISILQDPENTCDATVKVLTEDGYVEIGALDESAKKFELDSSEYVYGLKLEFNKATDVSLYEIYLDADKSVRDDIGEYVEPIVLQPSEEVTEPTNLSIGKNITVSGTSDGNKDNVNDGNTSTKWDSNFIKSGTGSNAQDTGDSWIYIDLGSDKTSIFDSTTIKYFNKIYPTLMKIQISNNAADWITVSELTRAHNGTTHPVVTEALEPAYAARYVRLYFEELNNVAGGNGIGVTEWEINGVSLSDVTVKSVENFEDKTVELNTSVETFELKDFVTVVLTHKTLGDFEVLVPVVWNTDVYDAAAAGTYTIEGTLNLPKSVANAKTVKAAFDVIVEGGEEPDVPKKEVCKIFVDVDHGAWYENSVQYVYDEGIIIGDGNVFAPNDVTTRAMVAVILYRLAGSPKVTEADYAEYNKFTDLPKEHLWYSDAVAWALKEKVSTGDDVNMKYNPTSAVTREQLALFLWRYAKYTGKDTSVDATYEELFGETYVNDWAKEGFAWAVENGVIKGAEATDAAGNTYFDLNPQGGATRAQFARVIYRYVGGATD